ncbi:MAG: hypothetical protein HC769_15100 [Cyanobacteria bacterium CRU_2_1]|nr:hypothetical protein [Cyanobacteria bacterium CRU_2_1]
MLYPTYGRSAIASTSPFQANYGGTRVKLGSTLSFRTRRRRGTTFQADDTQCLSQYRPHSPVVPASMNQLSGLGVSEPCHHSFDSNATLRRHIWVRVTDRSPSVCCNTVLARPMFCGVPVQ